MRKPHGLYNGVTGLIAKAVDRVVDTFNPESANRRLRARAMNAALLSFDAARRDRTRRGRDVPAADTDLLPDLAEIRENSRALVRDDSHAAALVEVLEDNIVGTGLRPQSTVKASDSTGLTEQQADDWNGAVEDLWNRWAENDADATEQDTFYELQRQVLRGLVVDGEVLGHRLAVQPSPANGRSLFTAIELVDPDRLESPSRNRDPRDDRIRGGVELGDRGQPIRYWITPRHPRDHLFSRIGNNDPRAFARFRAGMPNIVHVYRRDRPGQTRGVPRMAPSFGSFDALNDYFETELTAARAAAKICMFVKQAVQPDLDPTILQGAEDGEYHERLQSGTIRYLNEGEEIEPFNPSRPGSMFDPFVVRVLRAICASFGLPYELVAKDFGGMNYSSARVALLEARRGFELVQRRLVAQWCRPWWRSVIVEGLTTGALPLFPGFIQNPAAFMSSVWVPPSWGWVDPTKEIQASSLAIANNLSTPQQEAARNGLDLETILEQRARAERAARNAEERFELPTGTLSPPGVKTGASSPAPAEDEGDDETSEPEGGDAGDGDTEETSPTEEARQG